MDSVKKDQPYRVSEIVDEGYELLGAARQLGLEGIMAKDIHSKYTPGKRSTSWYKIKVRNTTDCVIIGYTPGKGDRNPHFGALHIATKDNGELTYRGKVGTGFDSKLLKSTYAEVKTVKKAKRPVMEKPLDDAITTWIEPKLWCEIQFASITPNGTYREPVFIRMRPDLS
jgi:ATP-dependent DNA ligase